MQAFETCSLRRAASSCNMYTKTFTGIDGAGKRLAQEVSLGGSLHACQVIAGVS